MIKIGIPTISNGETGRCRLSATIECNGVIKPLWFEVDEEYGKYLCPERCDAFVLAVLQWAMKYGHDIECAAPMTERLYEQLCGQFLPAFYRANEFRREGFVSGGGRGYAVKIICPTAPEVEHAAAAAIGTGVSTGVDSLHVFAAHPEITHACLWTGEGANDDVEGQRRTAAWKESVEHSREFVDYIGKKFIVGRTNFFDSGCLPKLQWSYYTTFGNLFCIFALQKLWSTYYIASDCGVEHFKLKISLTEDPAHYEFFLFPWVSIGRLAVRMDGADITRADKVRDLTQYEPAQKFLNTCWRWDRQEGHKNCSHHCPKCMRTMLTLYGFDALDKFSAVYDVEYFKRNFHQYLAEYYRGLIQKDFFITELRPYLSHMHHPLSVQVRAWIIVLKKSLKKAFRFGCQSGVFSPEG